MTGVIIAPKHRTLNSVTSKAIRFTITGSFNVADDSSP
jgi:hypothetical protein